MSGSLNGVFEKDGVLLDRRMFKPNDPAVKSVEGERYNAVAKARDAQVEIDRARMNETGILDIDGHKRNVRFAMQAALTAYDAEQYAKNKQDYVDSLPEEAKG